MQDHNKTKVELTSFLSPNVRHMLVNVGEGYQDIQRICNSPSFLTKNVTFNWKIISALFGELTGEFNIHNQSSDWFVNIVHKLWPVFSEAHQLLLHSDNQFVNHLWALCQWTRMEEEIKQQYGLFIKSEVSTTETVLFLTAVLERSLGNLYLLEGNAVPSLLRDLLATSELFSILGRIPIIFLQVLMGTPLALNIRNVAWHGFLQPNEIYPQLVSTLFLVTASIGELLILKNIGLNSIPRRTQICFESEMFAECFPIVNDHCTEVLQMLFRSTHIASSHHTYWKCVLKHYMNAEYGASLLLLLPQLEHMLRCMFCSVNGCPDRVLTAESTAFYITLNEILAAHLPTSDGSIMINNVHSVLGDTLVEMLQDIFVHQAGPRIRDKLGHGECNLCDVPQLLTNHVICVALVIALETKGKQIMQGSMYTLDENINSCVNSNTIIDIGIESFEDKIMCAYKAYVSKFHPSTLLKMSIISVTRSLDEWQTYLCPDFDKEVKCEPISLNYKALLQLQCKLCSVMNGFNNRIDITCEQICEYVLSVRLQTVFRPKSENETVSILRHIVDNIKLISTQVKQQLHEKFHCYSQHKLRSRQRDTYKRMLDIIPYLNKVIYCVVFTVMMWLHKINSMELVPRKEYQQTLKFFRNILQFVENVASYTSLEKNRWTEAGALAERFCQDIHQTICESNFL